jgi:hypothetical protein
VDSSVWCLLSNKCIILYLIHTSVICSGLQQHSGLRPEAPGDASPAAWASGRWLVQVLCESAQWWPRGGPSSLVLYPLKGTRTLTLSHTHPCPSLLIIRSGPASSWRGRYPSPGARPGALLEDRACSRTGWRYEQIIVIFSGYLQTTFDGPPRGHPWADSHQTLIGLRPEAQAVGLAAPGACGRRPECS